MMIKSGLELVQQTDGIGFDRYLKFAFVFVLAASFVFLHRQVFFRKAVANLRRYGKRSLINYMARSVFVVVPYAFFGFYPASVAIMAPVS